MIDLVIRIRVEGKKCYEDDDDWDTQLFEEKPLTEDEMNGR